MKRSDLPIKLTAILFALSLVYCTDGKVEGPGVTEPPVITFEGAPEDSYQVKTGKSILLEPTVKNDENASYRWLIDGVTVGTESTYLFSSDESGQYFVTVEVTNPAGKGFKEIRLDVVDYAYPEIVMPVPEGGFILLSGTGKTFNPVVMNDEEASFTWTVNNSQVADTREFTFDAAEIGEYKVVFRAENEDGSREVEFNISVRDGEDIPFKWEWEKDEYNMTVGRTVLYGPLSVSDSFDAVYTWYLEGEAVQVSEDPEYCFTPSEAGVYVFTITRENSYGMFPDHTITVNVFDNETSNQRPVTASSSVDMVKVWEYLPAPGQFINLGNYETMEQANTYAYDRLKQRQYVSLGAFGGYVVVGFDHSVVNDGGYNLQIEGNSFDGGSEPGIVWVMQDENGDGLPNDTWYELKGSEYGKTGTIQNYAVTYHRPSGPKMDTPWTDNQGGSGTVEANRFHTQDYYYPSWVKSDTYTLRGTRLAPNVTNNGSIWRQEAYEWGYADNFGTDRLTEDDNHEANVNANYLKIGNAVDFAGNPVNLKYIDFVKVQTAVQDMAGILGEVSTEVFGIRDFNMVKVN